MDKHTLTKKLMDFGMTQDDANSLITSAKYNGISIRKAIAIHFMGTYKCMTAYLFAYAFFVYDMDKEDTILFTLIYGCVFIIIYLFTPFLKGFFLSLIMIFKLRER